MHDFGQSHRRSMVWPPRRPPGETLDRYPVAPKNWRNTGCISIICSRPIASYI